MDPHHTFEWCVCFVRRWFQIVGQDIFQPNFQRAKCFFVLCGLWFISLLFLFIDVMEHKGAIRWLHIGMVCAALQVYISPLKPSNVH